MVRILRAMIRDEPGHIGKLTQAIGEGGADIGDIVKIRAAGEYNVRELELYIDSEDQLRVILDRVEAIEGIRVDAVYDPVLEIHRAGKIRMRSTVSIERIGDVRKIYTPGVATVCLEIQAHPEKAWDYTALGHTVAIVTNGTAVLGLGNIGVHAGLPVMEGKAVLLDRLAGLSGVPILIPSRDADTFVETVIQISPSFGAIQIEDVAAPECFEIEERLIEQLPIPVMHDDQHGTAVVCLAALLNAMEHTGLQLDRLCIGLVGLGAAGMGIAKLLVSFGVKDLVGTDINREATRRFEALGGSGKDLAGVMSRAQVVISTTGRPGLIEPEMVREGQIIFAISNPVPEITPQLALAAGAAFAVDGRSVNNALGFPGIFRGALDARTRRISDAMKIAAARTIAQFAEPGELVPALLHPDVHHAVAEAVQDAAREPADPDGPTGP
ncbi:MAG: NAD-dependent malic enzyme [Deltaproteobacteria bacterium]|nr:NAD-dependent malic enzyme [Deltaproteobacteria bacterium]MBW2414058.1 NAD-dependent malic enzyme [Deltaproteobacteria bacterium]